MHYPPVAAVLRAGVYSPNHICQDAAILNSVVDQLRKRGCVVSIYSEDQFTRSAVTEPVIINMCREQASIERLQRMEDQGCLVLNSGYGIENCVRERMTRIVTGNAIPFPESVIVSTDEMVRSQLADRGFSNCWVKKADFYSMHKEDVTYVRYPQEAQELLQEYFMRGIKRAVISKHVVGDLVKFYGIAGTDFFYWFHPYEDYLSMMGHDDDTRNIRFDVSQLRSTLDRMCDLLGIRIFGGDCVVNPDGEFKIIGFDDWPSFAPCRDKASVQIAKYVLSKMKERHLVTK